MFKKEIEYRDVDSICRKCPDALDDCRLCIIERIKDELCFKDKVVVHGADGSKCVYYKKEKKWN